MIENQNYQQPQNFDEGIDIDYKELLQKLHKEWRFLAKWAAIGAVVGLVIAFSIPRSYSAQSVIAPERARSSSSSNLSALASMAGINIGSMQNTDAMIPDFFPTIVNSTPFMVDLFDTPVSFTLDKETVNTDLYTYIKEYTSAPWWSSIIQFPFKALGWFMDLFREKEEKIEGFANVDAFKLTKEQTKMVKAISESITVVVDKKTYKIDISASAQNPSVAAYLCQAISDRLKVYLDEYHMQKAMDDLTYFERLNEESQAEYYEAQQAYADYVDANQGIVLNRRLTEQERLRNEMNLKYNLYNACAQQLQQAKARLKQETPVFVIISPATTPLKPNKPSKKSIFVGFIFLATAGAGAWVLGKDKVKEFFDFMWE